MIWYEENKIPDSHHAPCHTPNNRFVGIWHGLQLLICFYLKMKAFQIGFSCEIFLFYIIIIFLIFILFTLIFPNISWTLRELDSLIFVKIIIFLRPFKRCAKLLVHYFNLVMPHRNFIIL